MKPKSLLFRLFLFLSLLLMGGWLAVALVSWQENSSYINEFYDTQQMLFAKRLASAADLEKLSTQPPKTKQLLKGLKKKQRGEQEDDALAFAIFDQNGNMLLSDGDNGQAFSFNPKKRGFSNVYLADPLTPKGKKKHEDPKDMWRIVWLDSLDGSFRVAVGQELEYRSDMSWDLLSKQLFPWLIALPILLLGILGLVKWELRPLNQVAKNLNARNPQDTSALETKTLPAEVQPLALALNNLFKRTSEMIEREHAFISDAAHELRTPLTALRVQAEVAAMAKNDPKMQENALAKMLCGIERSSHLIEQLLNISRLEAMHFSSPKKNSGSKENGSPNIFNTPLNWPSLIEQTIQDYQFQIEKKALHLQLNFSSCKNETLFAKISPPQRGNVELVLLMLSNLMDNAVKYTPNNGNIEIYLDEKKLVIQNSGNGVPEKLLKRLGERFYRPPGQNQPGSGLGISIIQRVAELHNYSLVLANVISPETNAIKGFCSKLIFS